MMTPLKTTTTMVVVLWCTLVFALTTGTCSAFAWETEAEAASQLRHLLTDAHQHYNQGVLSTLFPSSYPDATYTNSPLSSPEYFAPCSSNGDLTFLALTVSQNWRNALVKGANATFVVQSNPNPAVPDWRHLSESDEHHHTGAGAGADATKWDPNRPTWRRGMPSKMRANLFGFVEELSQEEQKDEAARCFLSAHPDARKWAPGAKESPHHAVWVRFRVQKVYATGGFGDEHRIGSIARDVYARARPHDQVNQQEQEHHLLDDPSVDDLFADNSHHKGRQHQQQHDSAAFKQHPVKAAAAPQQPFA